MAQRPEAAFLSDSLLEQLDVPFMLSKTARDVYYHGSAVKQNMMVRKYNDDELGIYYFVDGHTGKTTITSIWKREWR